MPPESKRAKLITKALAIFMCKGFQLYSVVDLKAFRYLFHVLEPRYQLPSRTTMSRSVTPKLYQDEKAALLKAI